MLEPLFDGSTSPGLLGFLLLGTTVTGGLERFSKINKSLGGIRSSIEQDILDLFKKLRLDLLVDLKHAGIHDRHVETGRDRMKQKSRVHGFTHGVVPAEGERNIGETTAGLGTGKGLLDLTHGFDEVDGVVVVLLDAGRNRQDIRIKDDVLGIKTDLVYQQAVGAGADADLVLLSGGLPLLVEGHDDHGCSVALGETGTLQESLFSILETDRIQDTFSLETLHPFLEYRPLGAVDHDRHTADLGIGGQEIQEGLHHRLAVEHPLVDIHIQNIGPALDLLACDGKSRLVIARNDEF